MIWNIESAHKVPQAAGHAAESDGVEDGLQRVCVCCARGGLDLVCVCVLLCVCVWVCVCVS